MKNRKLLICILTVFCLLFLINCQWIYSLTDSSLPDTQTPSLQLTSTSGQDMKVSTNSPAPTKIQSSTDTAKPTATRIETVQTPTQEPANKFADEHIEMVLVETKRLQKLPEKFKMPPAEKGKEYIVSYLTVTEIKDIHLINMFGSKDNRATLITASGSEYEADAGHITGVKFSDPTHMGSSSELEEGAQCAYAFEVPQGIQPVHLKLTYSYKQDLGDDHEQEVDIEIDLTAYHGQVDECLKDDGRNVYVNIMSPYTSQEVTIDGQKSPNEWDNTFCIDLQHFQGGDMKKGKALKSRWWVQNDDQFIYYLARILKEINIKGIAGAYFWPEYTGTWAHSDGFYVNRSGSYQDHSNWDGSNWHKDEELSPPGSVDVKATFWEDNDFYWFEAMKALDSGDGYDWELEPGEVIGHNPRDSFLFVLVMPEGDYFRNVQMELEEKQ